MVCQRLNHPKQLKSFWNRQTGEEMMFEALPACDLDGTDPIRRYATAINRIGNAH